MIRLEERKIGQFEYMASKIKYIYILHQLFADVCYRRKHYRRFKCSFLSSAFLPSSFKFLYYLFYFYQIPLLILYSDDLFHHGGA